MVTCELLFEFNRAATDPPPDLLRWQFVTSPFRAYSSLTPMAVMAATPREIGHPLLSAKLRRQVPVVDVTDAIWARQPRPRPGMPELAVTDAIAPSRTWSECRFTLDEWDANIRFQMDQPIRSSRYLTETSMLELIDAVRSHSRGTREQATLAATINSWGGDVVESRRISRLVKTPFPGYRAYPNLHEFKTRHGSRAGYWFVRTSNDGHPSEWAWLDSHGYDSLPVDVPGARVLSDVNVVGWLEDSVLVFGLILVGVSSAIAIVLVVT